MSKKKTPAEVSKFMAEIGAKGGKAVTPKKLAHLASISSKGGKTVTAKKLAHLKNSGMQAKGGSNVTPKKLDHLAKARAAKAAKKAAVESPTLKLPWPT